MADIRNVASTALTPQTRPAQPSEAVRSAQKAFFQAALNGAPIPPRPETLRPATAIDPQARPGANLRPGSLLDIKV